MKKYSAYLAVVSLLVGINGWLGCGSKSSTAVAVVLDTLGIDMFQVDTSSHQISGSVRSPASVWKVIFEVEDSISQSKSDSAWVNALDLGYLESSSSHFNLGKTDSGKSGLFAEVKSKLGVCGSFRIMVKIFADKDSVQSFSNYFQLKGDSTCVNGNAK